MPDTIQATPTVEEVPFHFEELFFSRTDGGGIIQSGNGVFRRISQYDWSELLKKPHKIIRHSDMPRGVFHLFWDFLKRGKPIGAYVKNKAKDGRPYWVFAIATPMDGGYLSVRLKPSGEYFPIVQDVYRWLLALEKNEQLTPEESAKRLLAHLGTLGFGSYEEFMSVAVRKECACRDAQLGQPVNVLLARYEEMNRMAGLLRQETAKLLSSYELNRYVPLNLQVQSCQLGDNGKTLGVISTNYTSVSAEMREEVSRFTASSRQVFDTIFEGQFLLCTARVQAEVADLFAAEPPEEGQDRPRELALLHRQIEDYQTRAGDGLRSILEKIDTFQEDCHRMKMFAASLEVIRVMDKVDAARLTGPLGALNELIDDLQIFQASVSESLMAIVRSNIRMQVDTRAVIDALKAA